MPQGDNPRSGAAQRRRTRRALGRITANWKQVAKDLEKEGLGGEVPKAKLGMKVVVNITHGKVHPEATPEEANGPHSLTTDRLQSSLLIVDSDGNKAAGHGVVGQPGDGKRAAAVVDMYTAPANPHISPHTRTRSDAARRRYVDETRMSLAQRGQSLTRPSSVAYAWE